MLYKYLLIYRERPALLQHSVLSQPTTEYGVGLVLSHWRALRTAGIYLLATIRLTLGYVLSERWAVEDRGPEEAMVTEVGRDGGSESGENGKMERNG